MLFHFLLNLCFPVPKFGILYTFYSCLLKSYILALTKRQKKMSKMIKKLNDHFSQEKLQCIGLFILEKRLRKGRRHANVYKTIPLWNK